MDFEIAEARDLPEAFDDLVAAATAEGFRFLTRLASEWHSGVKPFDQHGEFLLLAWEGDELAGVGGLNVDPFAGDPTMGRLPHLYVRPASRGSGLGRDLSERIIAGARERFQVLRVRSFEAGAFYESLGFERTSEAKATHRLPLA